MVTNSGKRKYTKKKVMRGGEEIFLLFDENEQKLLIMGIQKKIFGSTKILLVDRTETNFKDLYYTVALSNGAKSKIYFLDLGNGLTPFQLINEGGKVYQYNLKYVNVKKRVHLLQGHKPPVTGSALNLHTGYPGYYYSDSK